MPKESDPGSMRERMDCTYCMDCTGVRAHSLQYTHYVAVALHSEA